MVDLLNSNNINNINSVFFEEESHPKLPPFKKKKIVKTPIPHYPNVDVPMTEKEIMEFQKKYPNRKIESKRPRPPGSEQIELKNLFGSTSHLENTEIYDNVPDVISSNSIVGDVYLDEDRTNNYIKGYWHHKLGNCYSCCANKRGNPLIIIISKENLYLFLYLIINIIIMHMFLYLI